MKRTIIFIAFTSWILTSCSPVLYTPTSQVTPLHEQKGDIEANASYGLQGVEANASYAVTDHIAVSAQGRIGTKEGDPAHTLTGGSYSGTRSDRATFGAGIGYYGKIEEDLLWNITGGFTAGRSNSIYYPSAASGGYDISGLNKSFYIQPLIGYKSKYFESILSCRTGVVNISDIKTESSDYNGKKINVLFAQPALTINAGFKNIKPFIQTGYTFANPDKYNPITGFFGGQLNATAGVKVSFGSR